jgi:hypothetical protein
MLRYLFLLACCLTILIALPAIGQKPLPALKVSENQRFLVKQDGSPFFWLGDTAWELFHRLDREEALLYLKNRAERGYTVIQAVALAELEGHTDPNPYGHLPLVDLDPARPALQDGPENDYWDHVEFIVQNANAMGIYIAFLPTWGRYWHDAIRENQNKPLFTESNALAYGEFLGKRFGKYGIIWVVGGDRFVDNATQADINRALAKGLKNGDGGRNLITFHPRGGAGSAEIFHAEPWLDFNMRQNGHEVEYTGRYDKTLLDYGRVPVKPVLDAEPVYEDHPVAFNAGKSGHTIAYDVRAALYWDLFDGAFGHTYGHHSVWQMYDPAKQRKPINNPLIPWQEAILQPGAAHMQFARWLLESRPFLTRIPDPSLIVASKVPTAMPGTGRYRFAATRDLAGTYAMVYAPVGRSFQVDMAALKASQVTAWWFNPRNGQATKIGEFKNEGKPRQFDPPNPGEFQDWVLVLDDAAKKYPAPGSKK